MLRYRKAYVSMVLQIKENGEKKPLYLIWEDGKKYQVDRVKNIAPAAAMKAGGRGMRYTLVISGRDRNFFECDGRWFTEVPLLTTL